MSYQGNNFFLSFFEIGMFSLSTFIIIISISAILWLMAAPLVKLERVDGKMDGDKERIILEENPLEAAEDFQLRRKFTIH